MKKVNIKRLAVSAMLVALSIVLSLIVLWEMPLGGSVTMLSMVPICLISVLYGVKYAVLPCLLYGVIQIFLGHVFAWGLMPTILLGAILFDYLIAFSLMCLSGIFRKKGNVGILCGVTLSLLARFLSHTISGVVFFKNLEQFELFGTLFANRPLLYSVAYNGFYMLPELVLTFIAFFVLLKMGAIKKLGTYTKE